MLRFQQINDQLENIFLKVCQITFNFSNSFSLQYKYCSLMDRSKRPSTQFSIIYVERDFQHYKITQAIYIWQVWAS